MALSVKILLKNGVLVTVTVARHSGDIERLNIDRSLVTRLPSNIDAGRTTLRIYDCAILLSLLLFHLSSTTLFHPPSFSPYLSQL